MLISDLSPADWAGKLGNSGACVRMGPFILRLQTSLPSLASAFKLLYADFSIEDRESIVDFHVRVDQAGGLRRLWHPQALFFLDGSVPFTPVPLPLALPMLEWGLNWCVAEQAHQYLVIHSAVVERGGQAILLPAPPGSGKSTLCAALAHSGWRLLSDELTLVRPTDGALIPLPRPIGLKNASIQVIRDFAPGAILGPVCPDTHKGTVAHLRPPAESVKCASQTAEPAWVVFVAYRDGASAGLQRVPKARAFLRLADNGFNYGLLGRKGFEVMARLIDSCQCYELSYGDLNEAVVLLASLGSGQAITPEFTRANERVR